MQLAELIPEAFERAERAVSADPDEPLAYDALASAHQLAGNYEEAVRQAERALEISPTCMAASIS